MHDRVGNETSMKRVAVDLLQVGRLFFAFIGVLLSFTAAEAGPCPRLLKNEFELAKQKFESGGVVWSLLEGHPPQIEIGTTGSHPLNRLARKFADETGGVIRTGVAFDSPQLMRDQFGVPLEFFNLNFARSGTELETRFAGMLGKALESDTGLVRPSDRERHLKLLHFRFKVIGIGLKVESSLGGLSITLHSIAQAPVNARFFSLLAETGTSLHWDSRLAARFSGAGGSAAFRPDRNAIYLDNHLFYNWDVLESTAYFHEIAHARLSSTAITGSTQSPFAVIARVDRPSKEIQDALGAAYVRFFTFQEIYTFERDVGKWLASNQIADAKLRAKRLQKFVDYAKESMAASSESVARGDFHVRVRADSVRVKIRVGVFGSVSVLDFDLVSREMAELGPTLTGARGLWNRLFHPEMAKENRARFQELLLRELSQREQLATKYQAGFAPILEKIGALDSPSPSEIEAIRRELTRLKQSLGEL